jgi:NitT/TauT family transport system ATP-binding protein
VLLADRIIVLGRDPAGIYADFEIDLPRPHDRKSDRFIAFVDHIYKILTKPKVEHAMPATGSRQTGSLDRGGPKYPMLPHARPGGIAGLLEMLIDRNGREDLYHLADELVMEVDDLLPIVEAASVLGFIHVYEGDVEITPEGRAFAEADIQTRKVLFREAALKHVPLLSQIEHTLKLKSDHTVSDDFFYDILEAHFSEDEAQRQLSTAINWGRYAELFDYDADDGKLFLPEELTQAANE